MRPTFQICLDTQQTVLSVKRMVGPAMRILRLKPDCIILMESPCMKNGWPTTKTNNNPTVCYLPLSPPMDGDINGVMVPIGLAQLLLSHGIYTFFTAIHVC